MAQDSQLHVLRHPLAISAPGKVILFGEHSVVYGKRALAFSLGLRTHLTISPAKDVVALDLPEISVEQSWSLSSLKCLFENLKVITKTRTDTPQPMSPEEDKILRSFLKIQKVDLTTRELSLLAFLHLYFSILSSPVPFSIRVKSDMVVGAGLGSSAAFAVCLTGALMLISGQIKSVDNKVPDVSTLLQSTLTVINDWAFICEKIMHGTPSGIDNTICTFGEGISFKSGKITRLRTPSITIMLVNTLIPRNTKNVVAKVKEKFNKFPSILTPLFDSMDNIAETALQTLNEMKANNIIDKALHNKYVELQELIDMNQCLLAALGVSHPSLEEVVAIAKCHGLHAKLTGAGGGGFCLILLPFDVPKGKVDSCKKSIEDKGYHAWITDLGGQGISFGS